MTHDENLAWLREDNPARLRELWQRADAVRRERVGDAVHLRGLVEISNHCVRLCTYCGLRIANLHLARYRMTKDEILACARQAVALGYGTIVLQSGEDPGITRQWMESVIRKIKSLDGMQASGGWGMAQRCPGGMPPGPSPCSDPATPPLAVTLSLGERTPEELAAWRKAGADRYLLKFETSNRALYGRIHPPRNAAAPDRMALLGALRELGYEVGSGVMIGIPGQTHDDLARDIELFASLDLDMIGVGPCLPHPATPLGHRFAMARATLRRSLADESQVANDDLTTYKVVALARLACPRANIPATTALATTAGNEGRCLALARGANVVMPNLTPAAYWPHYEVYPGRERLAEPPEVAAAELRRQIAALGRTVGRGPGDGPRGLSLSAATAYNHSPCKRPSAI